MKANFTLTKKMKRSWLILTALIAMMTMPAAAQTKHVVEVSNTVFTPDNLEIMTGDTVEWVNIEGFHNVNGTKETYPSNPEYFGNNTGNGWTYSHVFNTPGEYDYQCDPHVNLGMTGKITVVDATGDYTLTLQFSGMTPHVGQDLWLSVVEKSSGKEVAREMEDVSAADFFVELSGIETGHSYYVDFYVDFNENGMYDAPGTDHAWRLELNDVDGNETLAFEHNTNFTDIMWKNRLTVEFTGMTPHVDQELWLAIVEMETGKEIDRVHTIADEEFSVHAYGIEEGMSYYVDFFVDFNEDGSYNTPPTDHAWRMELNDVTGDTALMFSHNTNFTDIMWQNRLTVHFTGMTPHVGQDLWLAVKNPDSGKEVDRAHVVVEEEFMVHIFGIEDSTMYYVDFYADFNNNGSYDAPPVDHAWRLQLDYETGDTTVLFEHNTSFTDIMWENRLTVHFKGMTPHVGQDLWLAVKDTATGIEVDRVHAVVEEEFMIHAYGIEEGMSYSVDFFADFNENGSYDTPPADHAWRLELNNVMGDTTLTFSHNTNFTDIMWKNKLAIHFTGMTPHIGQQLRLAVVNKETGEQETRAEATITEEFLLHIWGIEMGASYNVDFFADFNENGSYDAPPVDHAWRLELNNVMGDTTLMFAHNTNFTDIMWKHELILQFSGMTPHVGQMLKLYVVDMADGMMKDSVTVNEIPGAGFDLQSASLIKGHSYYINFYADFNNSGDYDMPPADHAWQLELQNVTGDTLMTFAHNTDFTDIFNVTSAGDDRLAQFKLYPNPATSHVWIETGEMDTGKISLAIYDITGKMYNLERNFSGNRIRLNLSNLTQGIYLVEIKSDSQKKMLKLLKE